MLKRKPKTGGAPLVNLHLSRKSNDCTPLPLEMPANNLDDHLAQVAPLNIAAAVGLPPGTTYGQCLRQALLKAAIVDGDVGAAKELLERLEGKTGTAPQRDAVVTVRYSDDKLTQAVAGGAGAATAYTRRLWEYYFEQRLAAESADTALVTWRLVPAEMKLKLWTEIVAGLSEGSLDGPDTPVN